MNFKELENQLILETNHGVLVGELVFNKEENKLDIIDLYVYPGFRSNGFAVKLIDQLISIYGDKYCVTSDKWFAKAILTQK